MDGKSVECTTSKIGSGVLLSTVGGGVRLCVQEETPMDFQEFRCRVEADVRRLGRAAKRFEGASDKELLWMASHLAHEFSVGVAGAYLPKYTLTEGQRASRAASRAFVKGR
jgi:hypothetical protein